MVANDTALGVRTTRRWLARVGWRRLLNDFNLASNEWIASVSWRATTDRIVISDLAFGIDSASSRTRVNTFLVVTSLILRTLVARHTFRSTSRWRSDITGDARAYCLPIDLSALRVGSAGRWLTRIGLDRV